jgi:phage terminase small subunit
MAGRLNARQARFVAEYLIDLNATQAARRAGYSLKRSDAAGYDLLRNPEIAKAIQTEQAASAERCRWSREQSINVLVAIATEPEQRAADVIRAVVELNRMLGYNIPEQIKVANAVRVVIV